MPRNPIGNPVARMTACAWAVALTLFLPGSTQTAASDVELRPLTAAEAAAWYTPPFESRTAPPHTLAGISGYDFPHDPLAEQVRIFDDAWQRRATASLPIAAAPGMTHRWSRVRMPGEFEAQQAVMLGSHELAYAQPGLFAEIVSSLGGSIDVMVLVNDPGDETAARGALQAANVESARVHYVVAPHNTMWVRDYGPTVVVNSAGQATLVDADYDADDRAADEEVPTVVARRWQRPVVRAGLAIEGGNLLSNGRGIVIATEDLVTKNVARGWTEAGFRQRLVDIYGCRQFVSLQPMVGEPNGHVDMFAAFTSSHTVVVGRYAPEVDVENAAILDRNADTLSRVVTQEGPLNVVRIPMPARADERWPTYTNVIFANGVLLVPVYPDLDPDGQEEALDTFAHLLPGWRVVPINSQPLAEMYGGLHCISMNLGPIGQLPEPVDLPQVEPPIRVPDDPWPADRWSLRRYVPDNARPFPTRGGSLP